MELSVAATVEFIIIVPDKLWRQVERWWLVPAVGRHGVSGSCSYCSNGAKGALPSLF